MLVLIVLGCSVLVEPQAEPRCTREGGCPDGLSCVIPADGEFGRCMDACTMPVDEECNGRDDDCDGTADEGLDMIAEICNGVDDDCDNRIDEGNAIDGVGGPGVDTLEEGFDQDGDTFNTCGTQDCTDPDVPCAVDPSKDDCDDTDSNINPNAEELCDGTDHNCDGEAFPPGPPDPGTCVAPRDSLCEGGLACETDVGCVPFDCTSGRACLACGERQSCGEDGACVDLLCDPAMCGPTQYCAPGNPDCELKKPNGSECTENIECLSDFCAPGEQLNLPGSGVCFEPCCRDSECAAGEFCWGPGTGARSCLPADGTQFPGISSATGRNGIGSGAPGSSCSTGADCRSGRCDGSTCFGACGLSGDCPATCGLTDEGPGCRSGGDLGASCTADSQCSVDICSGSAADDICLSQTCTEAASCPDVSGLDKLCSYVRLAPDQVLSICDYDTPSSGLPPVENRGYGAECQVSYCPNFESCCGGILCFDGQVRYGCDSRTCISNRCTQACCTDASCPGGDVCRPQRITIAGGTFYPMFCVPPA